MKGQAKKPVEKSKKHHWLVLFLFIVVVLVAVGLYFFKQGTFDALAGQAGRQQAIQAPPSVSTPLNPEIKKLPVAIADDSQSVIQANNFKQFSGSPKPTKFTGCLWSFTPSGNSLQVPTGFVLGERYLAGVICTKNQVRCAYSSEKIDNILDMFSTSTLNSVKSKALVGSMSLNAVPSNNETWSNCQNDVSAGTLGCRCELG